MYVKTHKAIQSIVVIGLILFPILYGGSAIASNDRMHSIELGAYVLFPGARIGYDYNNARNHLFVGAGAEMKSGQLFPADSRNFLLVANGYTSHSVWLTAGYKIPLADRITLIPYLGVGYQGTEIHRMFWLRNITEEFIYIPLGVQVKCQFGRWTLSPTVEVMPAASYRCAYSVAVPVHYDLGGLSDSLQNLYVHFTPRISSIPVRNEIYIDELEPNIALGIGYHF